MAGSSSKSSIIVGAGLAAFAAAMVAGAGFFFARKSAAPEFASKIDQLMFDRKNKSPRYVLTLPDREKIAKKLAARPAAPGIPGEDPATAEEALTADAAMKRTPSFNALGSAAAGQKPLRFVSPMENLTEMKNGLAVPKVDKRGNKPWLEYGNQVEAQPKFFKIAVAVRNMGLNKPHAKKISEGLASGFSLVFSPYAPDMAEQVSAAREAGHETYIGLPMVSKDFAREDTGPKALSLAAAPDSLLSAFEKIVSEGNAAFGGVAIENGLVDDFGNGNLALLLSDIRDKGLLLLDASDGPEIPASAAGIDGLALRRADIDLSGVLDPSDIAAGLARAEAAAMEKGSAVVLVDPMPGAVLAVRDWAAGFSPQVSVEQDKAAALADPERPFALVPLSSVVSE